MTWSLPLVTLSFSLLAAASRAEDTPVPAGRPLPTTAVDVTRFPANTEARLTSPRRKIHVSPTGDDRAAGSEARPLRSIGRALETVGDGPPALILVHPGTYAEGTEHDDFALRIETDGIVVTSTPGDSRAVVRPAGENVAGALAIRSSHVVWHGISIEGFRSTGIAIGAEGRTLEDLVLAEFTIDMPSGGDGISVWPDHREGGDPVIAGLLVEEVKVRGADIGIQVGAGAGRDVALVGVEIANRSTPEGSSGADAFAIESGDNILVDGGEFHGAEGDGIDLKATRVAVINVHVHDCLRNGIKLWHDGDIVNALLHDCGADASIVLGTDETRETPRFRIVNTLVAFHNRKAGGGAAYAMTVGYDTPLSPLELEISNVVFHGNTGGIVLSKGTRARIVHSLLGPGPAGQVIEYGFDGASSESIEVDAAPAALERVGEANGNLPYATPPGFAQEDADSLAGFRPGKRSPLVDSGASVPGLAFDLSGAPRGKRPDIGPLEGK